MSYKPRASTTYVESGSGSEYVNVRIRCGSRAILFDPEHVDTLVTQLNDLKAEAAELKQRLIKEKTDEYREADLTDRG